MVDILFDERLVGNVEVVGLFFKSIEHVFGNTNGDGLGGGFEVGKTNRLEV